MKTPKDIYVKTKEGIEAVAFDKAIAALAKEEKSKKDAVLELVKDVLKEDDQYDYSEMEEKAAKAHKALHASVKKLLTDSEKNKKELNEAIAAEEEAAKKKGEMIVKAAEKGASDIAKLETGVVETLQKAVGNDFIVSDHGLSLAKGVAISPDSISRAISGINNGAEILSKARTTFLTTLGDAVNLARKEWGEEEGDNIVAQAIPETGQGKHNVLQSAAVMAYIDSLYDDHKDRPLGPNGLSFTHLQEAKNYGRNKDGTNAIAPAKVRKILAQAVEEKLSCADMRELLKKARPQEEVEEGDEGDGGGEDEGGTKASAKELFGFLYIQLSDVNRVLFTEELDKDMLKEEEDGSAKYHVIDLAGRAVLKTNGKVEARFVEVASVEESESSDIPE